MIKSVKRAWREFAYGISLSLLKEYNHKLNYLKILAIDQSASACNLSLENAAEVLLQQKESDSSYQEKGMTWYLAKIENSFIQWKYHIEKSTCYLIIVLINDTF